MSKRYWVKLVLKIYEYDESSQRISKEFIRFEPATNLTPEPARFVREALAEQAAKIAEAADYAAYAAANASGQQFAGPNRVPPYKKESE